MNVKHACGRRRGVWVGRIWLISLAASVVAIAPPSGAAAPHWGQAYSVKATWYETLAASWIKERAPLAGSRDLPKQFPYKRGAETWFLYLPKLFADFPGPEPVRQICQERVAGIWDQFLHRGSGRLADLARGYAGECLPADRAEADRLADKPAGLAAVWKVRNLYYRRMALEAADLAVRTVAFVDKSVAVGPPRRHVAALAARVRSAGASADWPGLYEQVCTLRRKVLFRHPALAFPKLLISKHAPPRYSHNCDQYLARHARGGPGLCVLTDWKSAPKCASLLGGKLPAGDVNHPTLSFDAKKVIFAWCCKSSDRAERAMYPGGFFIHEADTDGSSVRQLTGTASDKKETIGGRSTVEVEDFDPCYVPGGGFVFTSTRSQNFGRCHGGRYTPAYLLYRADADGSNIRPISYGEANEHFPSILNDGRVVFTRWEYNDRNQIALHKLWWMYPDGTSVSNYYGVNSATPWAYNYHDARASQWYANVPPEQRGQVMPYMISETRAIPHSRKVVATATSHHCYTAGALVTIDPDKGADGYAPLHKLTPEVTYPEAGGWGQPGNFMTPMPVTEDLVFAAYSPNWIQKQHTMPLAWGYGIVLVDTLGGREPIYRDPAISCVSPLPLVPRQTPPVFPSQLPHKPAEDTGTLIVQNVYLTRNDPEGIIRKGDIKALRVVEMISLPTRGSWWAGEREDFVRRILGTVAVGEDGSAMFTVPARKTLYLQALDADGAALLTLRSLFHVMPGERRSCIGCHEQPGTPRVARFEAMKAPPRKLTPPAGPRYEGGFSFKRTVQPVLDRYCISCHGLDKTDGKLSLLGALGRSDRPRYITKASNGGWAYVPSTKDSWLGLVTRPGLVKVAIRKSNFGPDAETVNSRPKDFFALAGKLVPMLRKGHAKVQLDRASLQRITDWADMNYIRFGDYKTRDKVEWHVPDKQARAALRAEVRKRFGEKLAAQPIQALVNVAQPDESRILKAPLAVEAGGWGQVTPAWKSTEEPGYKAMRSLVEACAAPESARKGG